MAGDACGSLPIRFRSQSQPIVVDGKGTVKSKRARGCVQTIDGPERRALLFILRGAFLGKGQINENDIDSSAPGERNKKIAEYKAKNGLPMWRPLVEELKQLAERHDQPWADELKARIDLHRKYVEFQTVLARDFSALGLNYLNSFNNAIDLQSKLFDLEERLRKEGKNPLESEEWVKGRELLSKELQFIHKHKLDAAKFELDIQNTKKRQGDDDVFVIEAEVSDGGPE